jgi:hypothetical protein
MNAPNDMSKVIIPKSDQINADDLLTGPRTITIREVTIRPGTDQPVSIFFDGDNGKPYKCCKSMARVMVHAWGPDANKYVGRSMTLYRDPNVKWGGMQVGGIRISHMSNIDRELLLALTETKGKRAPFIVKPLVRTSAASAVADQAPAADQAAETAHPHVSAAAPKGKTIDLIVGKNTMQADSVSAWLDLLEDAITNNNIDDGLAIWDDNLVKLGEITVAATNRKNKEILDRIETMKRIVKSVMDSATAQVPA